MAVVVAVMEKRGRVEEKNSLTCLDQQQEQQVWPLPLSLPLAAEVSLSSGRSKVG